MSSLDKLYHFCFLISHYDEEILDLILAASNVTEDIIVIFMNLPETEIIKFKALQGFGINAYNHLAMNEMDNYIQHSEKILAF